MTGQPALAALPGEGCPVDAGQPAADAPNGAHMWLYLAGLLAVCGAMGAGLASAGHAAEPLWLVLGLGGLAALAERSGIRLSRNLQVSISLLPTLFAAVVFGPVAGMVVGAMSMLGALGRPYMRWAVYTCTGGLIGGGAGLAAAAAATLADPGLGGLALATVAGVVTAQALDLVFCSFTLRLRGTQPVGEMLRTVIPVLPTAALLYTAVVGPLAFAYLEISPWSVGFFLLPALAAQRLFAMYQAQRELADDLAVVNDKLERANLSFASALVTTLDARDRYTAGHSAAVAVYSRDIAAELGMTPEEQQTIHLAGLLHDIGKIGVTPGILEKPGPLTLAERRKMEEHSAIGERILANVEAYAEIARIVRHHHERIDGRGYPDGITADEIPLVSRIICVADAYNAMTSDRPYRDAMPSHVARERLLQAAGSQFDAAVVEAFVAVLLRAPESYSTGATADFAVEAQAHPELRAIAA
ncbi:MAG: HD domain-containing protein [Gaiellales bacterium]